MKSINNILSAAMLMSLFLVNCKCNESETNSTNNSTDTTAQTTDPTDSTITDGDSSLTADTTEIAGVPAINSSYYGQDPSGAEVTYNFFGGGKFEKFSFKGSTEKNIAGTWKQDGDVIKLSSAEGEIEFKNTTENVYDVMSKGKKLYSVKRIDK